MIIPVAALIALLVPVLLGGSPARMAGLRLRHGGWIAVALGVQILIIELLTGPKAVLEIAHIATYVVAVAFLVLNRRIPGLLLVGFGTVSNGLTITLNDGTLPARAGALHAAGLDVAGGRFVNSGVVAHPHLAWLGDVFAVPSSLPLANVFSVGDVLIILGVGVASWSVCGTRWTRPWTPAPRHRASGGSVLRRRTAPRGLGRVDGTLPLVGARSTS